jgi:hypothetical protein
MPNTAGPTCQGDIGPEIRGQASLNPVYRKHPAWLAKPANIERLRATLEHWRPIQDGSNVVTAWLGEDRAAIDALLGQFRGTAVEAEREIIKASRTGSLPLARFAQAELFCLWYGNGYTPPPHFPENSHFLPHQFGITLGFGNRPRR